MAIAAAAALRGRRLTSASHAPTKERDRLYQARGASIDKNHAPAKVTRGACRAVATINLSALDTCALRGTNGLFLRNHAADGVAAASFKRLVTNAA